MVADAVAATNASGEASISAAESCGFAAVSVSKGGVRCWWRGLGSPKTLGDWAVQRLRNYQTEDGGALLLQKTLGTSTMHFKTWRRT